MGNIYFYSFCFWLSLIFFLLDIVLDFVALVDFYQEGAYWSFSILLVFMVGSFVMINFFSWLWYSYESNRKLVVEKLMSQRLLQVLQVLQLGVLVRQAGLTEMFVFKCLKKKMEKEELKNYARGWVLRKDEFTFLTLMETCLESVPQLLLMLTLMLQHRVKPRTVLKAAVSASTIAFSVTSWYNLMYSSLIERKSHTLVLSVVFFFWNLILISTRLVALALFASVLPCFIPIHFFGSWIVSFAITWTCKETIMDSPAGECLFRASVAIFWYFDVWYNIFNGEPRNKALLYHSYVLLDICLLCGLWFWKTGPESWLQKTIVVSVVVVVHVLGLILKAIYQTCYDSSSSLEQATTEDEQKPYFFITLMDDEQLTISVRHPMTS